MSEKALRKVWRSSHQGRAGLLLLICLALEGDDDGLTCATVGYLAARCRSDESYIRLLLQRLEEGGEIVSVGQDWYRLTACAGGPSYGRAGEGQTRTEGARGTNGKFDAVGQAVC